MAVDITAPLTIGEEVVVLTKHGDKLIGTLIRRSEQELTLYGIDNQDAEVTLNSAEVLEAQATAGFFRRRCFLPPGTICSGDLSATPYRTDGRKGGAS